MPTSNSDLGLEKQKKIVLADCVAMAKTNTSVQIKGPCDFKEGERNYRVTVLDHVNVAFIISNLCFRGPWWLAQNRLLAALQIILQDAGKNKGCLQYTAEKTYSYVTKSSTIAQLRILVPIKPLRLELEGFSRRAQGISSYNKLYSQSEKYSARWISEVPNRTRNDPVVLYFHGGGYALKMASPQVNCIINMARDLLSCRVSIIALDYTVTPYARYPDQLHEGMALYEDVAQECNRIVLLGDSCGGNLALAITQAIDKSRPDLPKPWGMVLASPWVDLRSSECGDSSRDIMGVNNLDEMQKLFCETEDLKDPICNPAAGGSFAYWKQLLPTNTVCVWGSYETLRPSCKRFAAEAEISDAFEEKHGQHDCMIQSYDTASTRFIMERVRKWFDKPTAKELSPKTPVKSLAINSTPTRPTPRSSSSLSRVSTMLSVKSFFNRTPSLRSKLNRYSASSPNLEYRGGSKSVTSPTKSADSTISSLNTSVETPTSIISPTKARKRAAVHSPLPDSSISDISFESPLARRTRETLRVESA